ncbi:DegV family protein [Paenibacillus albidus]|uniref:DegV family protein n=1 Tax=Paenibacillus albidus TaxID=2041023 RepID=UPI00288B52D5|nr:DegV family protein [Paenibacillus albidus]
MDLSTDQICKVVLEQGKVPGIAAPSMNDFISAFTPVISAGKDVLFISIASELSPAYKNAVATAGEFPSGRVRVIDSASLSSGTALLVMQAVLIASKGFQVTTVIERLQRYRQNMQFTMLLDDTGTSNIRGNVYGLENRIISPLALRSEGKVKTGRIRAADRYGQSTSAVDEIIHEIMNNQHKIDSNLVIISQTLAERPAEYLKAKLIEMTSIKNILIASSLCGLLSRAKPRSLAVSYLMKSTKTKSNKQEKIK